MTVIGFAPQKENKGYSVWGITPLNKGVGHAGHYVYLSNYVINTYNIKIDESFIGKELEVYYDENKYVKAVQVSEPLKK